MSSNFGRRGTAPATFLVVAAAALSVSFASPAGAGSHPTFRIDDHAGFAVTLGNGDAGICVLHGPDELGGDICDSPGAIAARKTIASSLVPGMILIAVAYVEERDSSAVFTVMRDPSTTSIADPSAFAASYRRGAKRSLPATSRYLGPADESDVSVSTLRGMKVLGVRMTIEASVEGRDEPVALEVDSYAIPSATGLYVIYGAGQKDTYAVGTLANIAWTAQAKPAVAAPHKMSDYDLGALLAKVVFYGAGMAIVGIVLLAKLVGRRRHDAAAVPGAWPQSPPPSPGAWPQSPPPPSPGGAWPPPPGAS